MNGEKPNQSSNPADPIGAKQVLTEVARKLSSQALLFGLAVIVLLVATWHLDAGRLPLVGAILVVFVVAMAGYLFFEQKRRQEHGATAEAGILLRDTVKAISNPAGGFAIELWTASTSGAAASREVEIVHADKERKYLVGDSIVVRFRTTSDCYLTLLNVGTSGKLTILFPNALHPDNFVRAGDLHQIPDRGDGFEYRLGGPPGTERLKAIATLTRTQLLATDFSPDGALFETRSPTAAARDISIVKTKVEGMPPESWAETTCQFSVSDR